MAGRYGLSRLVENKDFSNLQNKLDNLYETYESNSNYTNVDKTCEIIEKNADVQRKLHSSLHDTVSDGPIYHCPRPLVSYRSHCLPHCDYTHSHTRCSPCYTPTLTASTVAAIAASASLSSDLALCRTISKKNAEIEDLSIKYKTDVTHLEYELHETKMTNDELKATLDATKAKLENELISTKQTLDLTKAKLENELISTKQTLDQTKAQLENELNSTKQTLSATKAKLENELHSTKQTLDATKAKLEDELNSTKQTNEELKAKLDLTKERLESEKAHLEAIEQARQADINYLKNKLSDAEAKMSTLEPRAIKATELEKEIFQLKDEIRHVRTANYILTDENIFQAEIIRSRAASPCYFIRSRTPSPPCVLARSRCASPIVCHRSRPASPPCVSTRVSPLSPNHCTQVVRQEALITRFNDLYLRDRLTAMDTLRAYSDNYENNQRIIFAAVQDSFSSAKRAFYEWKIRVRSTVAVTHIGPETLEEAVQDYINRNVDLYDMPRMVSDVLVSLNRNPKISLPCGITYSVISQFIRETCRMAWEMTALAYPLDTAFALDAEVIDESRYRRSFDSEFSAPLISHHIWPCLMQSGCVISRGEACTRRGASLHTRTSRCQEQSHSSMRRSRSTYHH